MKPILYRLRGYINWFARLCGFVRISEYRRLMCDYQSLIASAHGQWLAFERHKEEFELYRYKVDANNFAQAMKASKTYGVAQYRTEELSNIIHMKDYRR